MLTALLLVAALSQDKPVPTPGIVPVFSKVEALTVQNLNLKAALIDKAFQEANRAKADWEKELATFKADIEAAYPGWEWNPADGKWSRKTDDKGTPKSGGS